jgi:site-specific recombinase XerD
MCATSNEPGCRRSGDKMTGNALSQLTRFLRWAAARTVLESAVDLTPARWFTYLDERLAAGIKPVTTNKELHALQSFLRYLAEVGTPICDRMLQVERLRRRPGLPKDVSLDHLQRMAAEIEADAASNHAGLRRAAPASWTGPGFCSCCTAVCG